MRTRPEPSAHPGPGELAPYVPGLTSSIQKDLGTWGTTLLLLLLLAGMSASGLVAQAPTAGAVAPEPEISEEPSRPAESRPLTGIWWNRPRLVEALALTDEQRLRMDTALRESLAERRRLLAALREHQQDFAEGVTGMDQTDQSAARKAADALAQATAEVSRFEARIKIDVLAHLSVSQRQRLKDDYPRLLLRPWVRQEAVRRSMARRGTERRGTEPRGPGRTP